MKDRVLWGDTGPDAPRGESIDAVYVVIGKGLNGWEAVAHAADAASLNPLMADHANPAMIKVAREITRDFPGERFELVRFVRDKTVAVIENGRETKL